MKTATVAALEVRSAPKLEIAMPPVSLRQMRESLTDIFLGPLGTLVYCMYSSNWGERPLTPDILTRDVSTPDMEL